MAEQKILNARFKMKYDTFENWQTNSEAVLLKGEIGVVEMPQSAQDKMQGTPPIVAMKVGDGVKKFSELPYVTALAGDVYSWAKAEQKPKYTATEIEGIDEEITAKAAPAIQTAIEAAEEELNEAIGKKADQTAVDTISGKVTALETTVGGEESGLVQQVNTIQETVDALGDTYAEKTHTHTSDQITDLADKLALKADESKVTGIDTRVTDLESKITGLTGAMHFVGVVEEDPASIADKSTYHNGDVVAFGNKEYVFKGEGEEGEFVELGDTTALSEQVTALDSTVQTVKAAAEANTAKLAGITQDTVKEYVDSEITTKVAAEEQRATQAEEKALADAKEYADSKITDLNMDQYVKTEAMTSALAAKAEKVHTHKLSELVDDEETVIVFDGGDSSNLVAE